MQLGLAITTKMNACHPEDNVGRIFSTKKKSKGFSIIWPYISDLNHGRWALLIYRGFRNKNFG